MSGINMVDMGRRETTPTCEPMPTESKVHYPSLTINDDKLTALKGVKRDEMVTLVIKCKVTEVGRKTYGDKTPFVQLDIHKAGRPGKTLKQIYRAAGGK